MNDDAGPAHRARGPAGDFFERVPERGDVYVLSQILHDWEDDRATLILRHCRAAMAPGARLAVVERVLPELGREAEATDPSDFLADMNMMAILTGRERTATEFASLLAGAVSRRGTCSRHGRRSTSSRRTWLEPWRRFSAVEAALSQL